MIEGLESLEAKLDKLTDVSSIVPAMKRAMLVVQGAAKAAAPTNRNSGGGALRGSIHTDVESTSKSVTGICYTNLEYAPYVEFGTGPVGQAEHQGVSPNVKVSYRQEGWIMPATAMSESDAMAYGFLIIKGKDGQIIGYGTRGQRAQPFMYPALADNRNAVIKELTKAFNGIYKGVSK